MKYFFTLITHLISELNLFSFLKHNLVNRFLKKYSFFTETSNFTALCGLKARVFNHVIFHKESSQILGKCKIITV